VKRNRAQTEQRIAAAARALILESGFRDYGVNAVAARAGVDKVLIYRYFKGADGLLAHLGEVGCWHIAADALDWSSPQTFLVSYRRALRNTPLATLLGDWSRISDNPLTHAWQEAQRRFWDEAERRLRPQSEPARALLKLVANLPPARLIEAPLDVLLAEFPYSPAESEKPAESLPAMEDHLPTNLL